MICGDTKDLFHRFHHEVAMMMSGFSTSLNGYQMIGQKNSS